MLKIYYSESYLPMFKAYMMFIDYPKYLVHYQVFHKILNKAHKSRIP